MRRVAVIGNGAGGKTTLARALSERLAVPHHEVDAVQYRGDWSRAPASGVVRTLDGWLAADGWIIDGFGPFACVRRRLDAADTIVWVDLPLRTHLWRALRRQLVQGERRPTWLMLKTIVRVHRRFRPRWEVEFVTNRHKLVRLRSPGALRQFLEDSRAEG